MLKEYTLKVTVRVGGDDEAHCDERLHAYMEHMEVEGAASPYEITNEEVLEQEVERE